MRSSRSGASIAAACNRIVCLTEEPTEVLYALGQSHRIVGISGFTVRPPRARREKPKVSAFTSAKVDEILALARLTEVHIRRVDVVSLILEPTEDDTGIKTAGKSENAGRHGN